MSIREVPPEQLAELFHHYHHALASDFETERTGSADWEHVPKHEKVLLVAAAKLALEDLAANEQDVSRRFFAKPGHAEWGC